MSHPRLPTRQHEVKLMVDAAKRATANGERGIVNRWRGVISQSASILGTDHDTTTYSRLQLSKYLLSKGQAREALEVVLDAKHLCESTMSANNDLRVPLLSAIADCYQDAEDYENAQSYWQKAYDATLPVTGEEHGTAIYCRQRAAHCLFLLGRFDDAYILSQANLASCRKVFGVHERTLFILIDAAKCCEKVGKDREAFKRWHEAVAMCAELPKVNPSVSRFCSKSAWHHRRLRRLAAQGKEFVPGAEDSEAETVGVSQAQAPDAPTVMAA